MRLKLNYKSCKVQFLTILFLIFLFIWILSNFLPSLRILFVFPLSLLLGIGFTSYFKEIFSIKNIILYIVVSIFLGLFLNTFVIFFLGILGVKLSIAFFILYVILVGILNVILFLILESDVELSHFAKNDKLKCIDKCWISFYILVFFLFIGIGLQNYFPNWDSFNYWAVEAKFIFQNSAIRKANFDLLNPAYLPFYPIQLNYIYLLYGDIVEQYSSLLTTIYAFLGSFAIIGKIIELKGDSIKKSLLYLSIFPILYSFYEAQGLIFTQYADIFCSVSILFFCIILFSDNYSVSTYWKRFLMLSLVAIGVYITKTSYLVVAVFLFLFYLGYDFKYLYKNIKEIVSKKIFLISILGLLSFILVVYSYISSFRVTENIVQYTLSEIDFLNPKRFLYLFDLLEYLFSELTFFSVYFVVMIILAFIVSKGFKEKQITKLLFLVILSVLPLGFYIIKMWGFEDGSLLRYIGLIFFAFAYFMIDLLPPLELNQKSQKTIFLVILLLVPMVFVLKIIDETNFSFNFSFHTGRYKDFVWHKDLYLLADKVETFAAPDSTIMLVDQEGELIGNMNMPVIILRYSLSDYSVGHQYRLQKQKWYDYMKKFSPDYILVFTYDNYWVGCNDILEKDSTYLIKADNLKEEYNDENCFFTVEDIIRLE